MTRFGPLLAATAALAVVLTACDPGDDPQPNYSSVTPTASASTSSSPTASPSPSVPTTGPNISPGEVAPTLPTIAEADSADAAQAFEGYYVRMIDWTYATSDPSILTPFYSDGCENCSNLQKNLNAQLQGGKTYRGSRFTIDRLALVDNDGRSGADFAISVEVSISALEILNAAGQVSDSAPASRLTLTNWLDWNGSKWLIVDQGKA